MQALYVGVSIAVFIAILVVLVLRMRRMRRISSLAMLGITIAVLGGLFYGDSRWIGGSLMGIGVLVAAIDAKRITTHKHG